MTRDQDEEPGRFDEQDYSELDEEIEIAPNEARVIVTLAREEEGIDGFIDTIEGLEFDPGDAEGASGRDVLRLAAEMVLIAAGYGEQEVQRFLDTASRGPMQLS